MNYCDTQANKPLEVDDPKTLKQKKTTVSDKILSLFAMNNSRVIAKPLSVVSNRNVLNI